MKLYIVLREELNSGQRLAQTAHAVTELHRRDPAACARWYAASNTVVVLSCPGDALDALASEPGAAEFLEEDLGGVRTAVALFPATRSARRTLRRLPLAV